MTLSASGIFEPLLGKTPWNVKIGVGSFLTLEFGSRENQYFQGKTRVHGEWHLWLQDCAWRIEKRNRIVAASGDEHEQLELTIAQLEFGPLEKARVSESLDFELTFTGSVRLLTFTMYSSENEQWELFRPDGTVLVAQAGKDLAEVPRGGLQSNQRG
jgi:hypothetical protein